MELIIDIVISSLLQAAPLALATFAIVLIFRTSLTTNFAQGMIGTTSAYVTSYILMPNFMTDGRVPEPNFMQYFLAIAAGILVGFLISLLVDVLIFRHAKRINAVSKQIITMGIILILTGLIPLLFGISDRSLPRLGANLKNTFLDDVIEAIRSMLATLGVRVGPHIIIGFILSVVILGTLFLMLRYTKWGLGVRATASNEMVAGMMGVNTRTITAMSWAIAGALGGLAAIFVSSNKGTYGNVTTYFMISIQVQAFFAAILGGFSTFYGPIVGVLILTVFNNIFNVYLNPWGTTSLYLAVMLVVLIKPEGLFGKKTVKKV